MPPAVSLAERLATGKPALSAWCGISEPAIPGLLAREGFDAVVLDMQHGSIDFAACCRAIPLVAAAGKPCIARIPVADFATASRLLDAGASGIIAPMINTVEDARRFASHAKYPPVGERSWGPHPALALTGLAPEAYFRQANGLTVAFAMVETREALAIIDDVLGVEGVDGIFIGPSDLSIALSGGSSLDAESPAVEEALDHSLARARSVGKRIGVYAATGERAGALARRGFDLVAIGSDAGLLRLGATTALQAARG